MGYELRAAGKGLGIGCHSEADRLYARYGRLTGAGSWKGSGKKAPARFRGLREQFRIIG